MGKTSSAAKNKYNKKAYDRITVIVKRGEKERIKTRADKQGLSLNAYIRKLIEKDGDESESDYSDPYNPAKEIERINGDIYVWDEETQTYYF